MPYFNCKMVSLAYNGYIKSEEISVFVFIFILQRIEQKVGQ